MRPESQLHPRDSQFHGWASSEAAPAEAMKLRKEFVDALLALPQFVDMDIIDLYRMAEDKLTYTKAAGRHAGLSVKGIKITDRAFAIAILVGYMDLKSPLLQMPSSMSFDGVKISL